MSYISDIVKDGYNNNTYSIQRSGEIIQQDEMFIDAAFERMVQNKVNYDGGDNENYIPIILDLGCGSGIPYTRVLAGLGRVVGCDISYKQIGLAKLNVPKGRFICKDITDLKLKHKYSMICMFHAFFNVDYSDKAMLLNKINYWLKPYGVAVITTYGEVTEERSNGDFFGYPMIWHHISPDDFEKMVTQSGLCIVDHDSREDKIGSHETHFWTLEKA